MSQSLDELVRLLEEAKEELASALEQVTPQEFAWEREGRSIRRTVEETADRFNLHLSRYLARALGLPPPPCVVPAQLGSPREAAIAVRIAHRRLGNLLHDLRPEDLTKSVAVDDEGLVQVGDLIERALACYRQALAQVRELQEAYRGATGRT
ncbi:MAG TPA: hypothetical protein VNL95_05310 [Dehalococcoidia bacterium]|nr:hypothetical protein [Dehalococcoidia bacterium]